MIRPIRPMLATLVAEPFHRPGWVYEEKYDGIRVLAYRSRGRVRLYSRNLNDVTSGFPEIVAAIEALRGGDLVLDGEIVAFDREDVSRFQLLQRRSVGERARLSYAVFDCLVCDGIEILRRPLGERRRALEALLGKRNRALMISRRLAPNGLAAYRSAQKRGWEGIIAKDEASPYEAARRSRFWLKVKCRREEEFVIGGFTAPAGQRQHFGALLVGLFDGPALRFAGKVGTGYSMTTLADLAARMRRLRAAACPFRPPPRAASATWVRPELVAQIAFAEWTADGKLRQPVFLGLRDDKKPSECTWSGREP